MPSESGVFELWWTWAVAGRSPWLVGLLALMLVAIARTPPGSRPRARVQVVLVLGHLATLMIGALVAEAGYSATPYRVAALALELFALIGITSTLLFRIILPRIGWNLPRILIDIITVFAVIAALIVVGKRAGLSVAGLITTSAVLTAVIGFALQDTLGNMLGGITLQMDRSINVGDWITIAPGQTGRVTEIRWRYTAIETREWTTVLIPNSVITKSAVTVLGRRVGEPLFLRRDVDFYVDFRTAPSDVIETVTRALHANPLPRMAAQPAPHVIFHALRDSVAWYKVRYWLTDLTTDEPTDSDVRTRVYYALRRAQISFSIPAQTVFIESNDEARRQRQTDRELGRRLEAIEGVDLLACLELEERRRVAETLTFAPFARGEAMTREGEVDDGLYMLVEGSASVRIGGVTGHEVARLGPGQFFGEMSLMTGEKRSATVVAETDVVTYRLDKPAFEQLMKMRPEIAEAVAELLAERKTSLDAARDRFDESARSRRRHTTKQDILGRIRGFFNLGT